MRLREDVLTVLIEVNTESAGITLEKLIFCDACYLAKTSDDGLWDHMADNRPRERPVITFPWYYYSDLTNREFNNA